MAGFHVISGGTTVFVDTNAFITLGRISDDAGLPRDLTLGSLVSNHFDTMTTTTVTGEINPLKGDGPLTLDWIARNRMDGNLRVIDTLADFPVVRRSGNGEASLVDIAAGNTNGRISILSDNTGDVRVLIEEEGLVASQHTLESFMTYSLTTGGVSYEDYRTIHEKVSNLPGQSWDDPIGERALTQQEMARHGVASITEVNGELVVVTIDGRTHRVPVDKKFAVVADISGQGFEVVEARDVLSTECFGPETPIDMWPLDPEFAPDPSNPNKIFDQDAVRAKIWKKPIAMIRKGDVVVSFDKNDNLMPGRVTRTFQTESKILLDYFGTRVTPGHVYFRPDSKKTDKFECLLDILRDDGMIQNVEGKNIRAATNVPVGDPRDGFVWAITQERKDGILVEKERDRIRLGTRFIVDGKTSQCVADMIEANGGIIGDDELVRFGDAAPAPFVWEHGATLPKPEDFVLQASGTTLTDIYKAGEWESRRPHMPAPMVMDGGPVQPLSATALSAMPRNLTLALHPAAVPAPPKRDMGPSMNRKQRMAMEAKQRRTAKSRINA